MEEKPEKPVSIQERWAQDGADWIQPIKLTGKEKVVKPRVKPEDYLPQETGKLKTADAADD